MNKNTGTLIGLGVGPGDPELMTLKAVRILQQVKILAVPAKEPESSTAFQIAKKAVPEISEKTIMGLIFPMTRDQNVVDQAMLGNEEKLSNVLDQGKDVVFLTLGDPTIYSTFYRIAPTMQQKGYPVKTVSGISSFCAVAAAADVPLVTGSEILTVYPEVPDTLAIGEGTTVFMKPGRKIGQLKEQLLRLEKEQNVSVTGAENCGLENQRIFFRADDISETAGYFTTIIVRRK